MFVSYHKPWPPRALSNSFVLSFINMADFKKIPSKL